VRQRQLFGYNGRFSLFGESALFRINKNETTNADRRVVERL
jgi:hypothetical protein